MDLECPDCGHRARVSAPGDYVCGDCQRAGRTVRMIPRGRQAVSELAETHSPAEVERRMAELNRGLARPRLRSAAAAPSRAADLRPGDRFRFLHQPSPWTTALSVERHGGMLTVRTPERGYMVRPDTPVEVD